MFKICDIAYSLQKFMATTLIECKIYGSVIISYVVIVCGCTEKSETDTILIISRNRNISAFIVTLHLFCLSYLGIEGKINGIIIQDVLNTWL